MHGCCLRLCVNIGCFKCLPEFFKPLRESLLTRGDFIHMQKFSFHPETQKLLRQFLRYLNCNHMFGIFSETSLLLLVYLLFFFFSPTHLYRPTHCSVFMGPVSQIRNACVKNGDFSFSRGVKLHYGCVWLRKRDVFLTYRDLCLFFFFFSVFHLKNV